MKNKKYTDFLENLIFPEAFDSLKVIFFFEISTIDAFLSFM